MQDVRGAADVAAPRMSSCREAREPSYDDSLHSNIVGDDRCGERSRAQRALHLLVRLDLLNMDSPWGDGGGCRARAATGKLRIRPIVVKIVPGHHEPLQ